MLNGGAVITPGTTTFTINCTGLAPDLGLLIGIASPIAGFNSTATPATFALNEFMGSSDATGPAEPTATGTGTLVNYVYTVPTSGAADTDAVCPPTAAQVAMGLPNCAMAVADGNGNEYGFGYVNYPSQPPWPASTSVPTGVGSEFGYTNPPNLLVSPSTVSAGGTVTLSSLPAAYCEGASLPATCGQFWADPDGTLTEPLTVEVYDSAGTINTLTANTQSPEAIGIDVYQPNGYGFNIHGGGTLTGGVLTGLTETIPTGGLADMGAGGATAFVPGALHFVVVEPSVAPYNDTTTAAAYDTVTNACTATGTVTGLTSTSCPIPGAPNADPSPVGAIATGTNALAGPLSVTTTSLPAGTVGSSYSPTLAATGGTTPYTWALTSGTLPSWATLNSATGAITGTPTAAGTTSGLEFTATDSSTPTHQTATSVSLSIVISLAPFSVTTTSLNGGNVGSSYATTVAATGGTTPYTWALTSGTLPSWATLNSTTGAITGLPTAAGTTSGLEFTATDSTTPTHETATSVSLSIVISLAGSSGGGTPPTTASAPTDLTATAGDAKVSLTWTVPSSDGGSAITGYDVYEGTSAGAEGTTAVNASLIFATTDTVTGLTNGTTYYFKVEAVNGVGNSAASNEASATPAASTTPPPPPPPPSSNPCASDTGNSAFLCSVYVDLLGRAPDSAGLAYWNALLTGGTSRSTVAYDIATSPEYRGDLVNGYYEAYLGRTSDPGGLSYWVAQLTGGTTDQTVAEGFLGSSEFYTDSGGTPGGFVAALYTDLLGRGPDSGGLAYWESELSSGTTQSAVAAGILSSTEYRSDFVETLYQVLLGRGADSGGLSYWVGQLAGGASNESVISLIVGSPEYYADATT
jgi:hypothetical protein